MRNHLISTVGTSLLNNMRAPFSPGAGISESDHNELQALLQRRAWSQVATKLTQLDPMARICGAEINSVAEIVKREKISLEHMHFLVSDTEDGEITGKLLENYFIERGIPGLQTVQPYRIEELQDANPSRFKTFGLRQLVRQIGELVKRYGMEHILIDATGGYKAQIAIAAVFGQALSIPVLYRFERFSEIVGLWGVSW